MQTGQENLQKPVRKRLLSYKYFLQSIIYNDRSVGTFQLVMVQNQHCDASDFNFGIFKPEHFADRFEPVFYSILISYSVKNKKNAAVIKIQKLFISEMYF